MSRAESSWKNISARDGLGYSAFVRGTLALVLLLMVSMGVASCSDNKPTQAISPTPSSPPSAAVASPSASLTPVAPTRTVRSTNTALPTLSPMQLPTPPADGLQLILSPESRRTGWFSGADFGGRWKERNLLAGVYQKQTYLSIVQFDLTRLAPGSKILYAALEISGRDASSLGSTGQWNVDLIKSTVVENENASLAQVQQAPAVSSVTNSLSAQELGVGIKKRFIFQSGQISSLENQLEIGTVTFRLSGPSAGDDNIFAWYAGPGPNEPTLYLVVLPAPFVILQSTPTPENVFAAATSSARQTTLARNFGTPTALPRSFATTTPAPNSNFVVVTSVPTPFAPIAQTATAVFATAVAATTGTFTPIPFNWVTATPRPLLIPREQLTSVPTPTPTPIPVNLLELAKKPLPAALYNKILFLEGPRDNPNVWAMDPDGSNIQLMTNREYFEIAKIRDTVSPDGTKWVYQWPDGFGRTQLWLLDLAYPDALPLQVTWEGGGLVFGQAWSPDGTKIAYTSETISRQELWVATWQTPRIFKRLTFSTGWYWNQFPSWSPDGKKIVYSSDRGHDAKFSEIWITDEDGTNQKNLGNGVWDTYNPVWIKWKK